MKKIKLGTIIRGYIKERIGFFLLQCLFVLIFISIFVLSHADVEVVLYAFLLCFFFGIIVTVVDFIRFYRYNKTLQEAQFNINVDLSALPETTNLIEMHYQELIRLLDQEKHRAEAYTVRKEEELIDYYTVWAHQIKTPIAAMRILLQSEENSQNAALSAELFRVEQYVQMVLSYLRLEGPNDFVLRKYSLESIVKQAVRKYAPLFIRQKIKLDLQPIDEMVLTDEKWLVFVLEQLLSNALKYTPKGKISIYMKSPSHLVIEDTGIGISPEDLPRIGEKGFTGYNGREQKQATGLGLYLCKKIMKRLSHQISFESEIGKGMRVILNFNTVSFLGE